MPADISTSLASWSTTAGSNAPADSTLIGGNLDDNLRQIQATVRAVWAQDTIASATTTDIGSKDAGSLTVTGTTTITGLGTVSAGIRKWLTFNNTLTLTHNGSSLILPGSANITASSGDVACFESLGSGNWRCLSYNRANGQPAAQGLAFPDGTVSLPGMSFASDLDNGFYRTGANAWAAAAAGGNVMSFSAGNVSIPTLSSTSATVTTLTSAAITTAAGAVPMSLTASQYNFVGDATVAYLGGPTSAKFATIGSVSGYGVTSFCKPGAANAHQFIVGQDPGGAHYDGVVSNVPSYFLEAMVIKPTTSANQMLEIDATNANTNAIYVYVSGPNPIWRVSKAGATFADGAYSGSGADYAEAFLTTEPLAARQTVALDGERVRKAIQGDEIIGVVSEAACAIGDAKLLDQGGVAVGLVGKLRVNKGDVIAPSWRLLKSEAEYDLYLVR